MHNAQPLVSIIIPVYKVEKYLKECVDSVRNQTYSNLDIILVDDGSPDQCGQMCDQYAAEDSRIRVIHQKNSGVARARNAGLVCAIGEYVFFSDSDDVVEQQALERLVMTALENNADMVCSVCRSINEDGEFVDSYSVGREPLCMDMQEALRYYAPAEWAPWNRLVKSDVHNGVFFPNYQIHEDEAIKFFLLERCRKVVQIFDPTYYYRQRKGSITSEDSKVDRMDMFYSRRDNMDYLKQYHLDIVELFLPNVCSDALYNLGVLISQGNSNINKNRILEIVKFVCDNYSEIMRNTHLSLSQKLRFFIIKRSDWSKDLCCYAAFYALLEKIRGRLRGCL